MNYFGIRPHQMGVGNVYYVIQSGHGEVAELTDYYGKTYLDGSSAIHATAASALTAAQAERNDYVIMLPENDSHDITAALAMDTTTTHLICPSTIGTGGLGFSRPRFSTYGQTVACVTLSANNCEIAGLFFKGATGYDIIDVSEGVWGGHIHDNFFGMSATDGSDNKGIDASVWYVFNIHDNHFTNFMPIAVSGTDNDLGYFISVSSNSSTRGIVKDNVFVTGSNTEVTSGVYVKGHEMVIDGNTFHQTGSLGASEAGTMTKGITTDSNASVINNMFTGAITAGNCITGPTADSCTGNMAATDGLIRVDPDGSHAIT